mmetsp:Transcript_17263/g.17205  ORF Transcript_17263/g.17205 Transcript_17263/m.17205 type:complete len:320 (+) Transcript_17263:1-960(+)
MISNSILSKLKSSVSSDNELESGSYTPIHMTPKQLSKPPSSRSSFSSSNSIDITNSNGKKCYVCGKSFTIRRKHICKFCNNAVCSDDSQKTRMMEGFDEPQRICDLCDQEETKKEIDQEIEEEIKQMNAALKVEREANERLNREYFDVTASVNQLETEIQEAKNKYDTKISDLNKQIQAEQEEKEKIREMIEKHKKDIEESIKVEKMMREKCVETQKEIEGIDKHIEGMEKTKAEVAEKNEVINEKIKSSLNLEQLKKLLCQRCDKRISEAFHKRIKSNEYVDEPYPGIDEDRLSVLDSVREMRQSLHSSNGNKECLIM